MKYDMKQIPVKPSAADLKRGYVPCGDGEAKDPYKMMEVYEPEPKFGGFLERMDYWNR